MKTHKTITDLNNFCFSYVTSVQICTQFLLDFLQALWASISQPLVMKVRVIGKQFVPPICS